MSERVRCVRKSPARIKLGELTYKNHLILKYLTRTQTQN
jgi:Zn-dependent M32 family carboxypeptidase